MGSSVPLKSYDQRNILKSVLHLSSIQVEKEEAGGGKTTKPIISRQRYGQPEQTCGNKKKKVRSKRNFDGRFFFNIIIAV